MGKAKRKKQVDVPVISQDVAAILTRCEAAPSEGSRLLCGKLVAAIVAGDANAAALAGYALGSLVTSGQLGASFVRDTTRALRQREVRQATAEERKATILEVYQGLSAEHLGKGRMHVYLHIADLSVGTNWECGKETVRKALRGIG